ncbi:hypothetical protein N8T08_000969 [Aspergillus melleus]|uniref:Uncharacterized protein n=1 Tax=Aspergillus melleus TaxID=138277 RepID=A0ACC3BB11_9EURO|nr:hypothetical protein N8T08_000969 [Aspergillus melleus]
MSDRLGSKRKAADDLQWPPDTQDSARQRSTAESTIKLTSILSILRANCRERLYVKPMAWTSSQLRHLDCKFEAQKNPRTRKERPPQAGPQDPSILITRRSRCNLPTARISPELIRATMQLSGCKTLIGKKYAIEEILSAFDIYPLP